jgi:tetratricopeptide (TPR) repeat protein
MRIAVLPFNAAEGTKPAYGRQFAAFAAEQLRTLAGAEINSVSFLTQLPDENGQQRMAFVNISEQFLSYDQLKELFDQAQVALVQDGYLEQTPDGFKLSVRYHGKESEEPIRQEQLDFSKQELFENLHRLIKALAETAVIELPESLSADSMEFGTNDPDVFLNFLEGYDALNYVQQANGQVAREFSPQGAVDALLAAVEADLDFEGPYHVLVQLCRQCASFRIGSFEMFEHALNRLIELLPDEYPAYFALGEIYQGVGGASRAAELFEKAVNLNPEDPALYSRLGSAQMQVGMPVNAERNFRKAMSLEGDDKPSADLLAQVLQQTGRAHEVPPLWKAQIEANAQNGASHAKYAISLIQMGKTEEGERAFESALETLEDNTVIKRYFAPLLAQKGEHDRAMDFYEDVLDLAPNDISVLIEYAQTLEAAGREFEVPNVLKKILQSNPDPNTRANTLARLIELEQPKRVETVEHAHKKMEEGDFQSAVRELRPMKNWLADYWKMWYMLARANNQLQQYTEAEEAARRALDLFPGCEPAYSELATAMTGQERHEDAYQLMRFAAANNPSSLPIHLNLGLAAKRAGHIEEARHLAQQIREALAQDPNRAQVDQILDEMER